MDLNRKNLRLRNVRRPLTAQGNFSIKQGVSVPQMTVPSTYRLNFFPTGDRKKKQLYVLPAGCPLQTPFAMLDDLKTDSKAKISGKKIAYKVTAPYIYDNQENGKKIDYELKLPYATSFSFQPKMQRDGTLVPPYALHTSESQPCATDAKKLAYQVIAPYRYETVGDD